MAVVCVAQVRKSTGFPPPMLSFRETSDARGRTPAAPGPMFLVC